MMSIVGYVSKSMHLKIKNDQSLSHAIFSMQVLLQRITWPREDDSDDEDCSTETKCRMSGYLRQFITNGRFTCLKGLANLLFSLSCLCHSWLFILMTNHHPFESTP